MAITRKVLSRTLTIGHGNGHNETSLVEYVKDVEADSFSAQEAQMLLPAMKKIAKHRVTVAGDGWTEARNRAKSTMIITKDSLPNIGEMTRKVSERIPTSLMVAPDRVLVCSMYEHPVATAVGLDGIAHFSLHPDAGPTQLRGSDAEVPIVREYREAMNSTRRFMMAARQDGLLLILTGDLQMPSDVLRPWSPGRMLAHPLRLDHRTTGHLDWILFDRKLEPAGPMIKRQLFDHVGFMQVFKARVP